MRPSGRYAAEISFKRRREWLGTFSTADHAARVYAAAAWRVGRPKSDLNFPEVETLQEAEWLEREARAASTREEEMRRQQHLRPMEQLVIGPNESDEVAMDRIRREHPHLVQAEMEFYWARDAEASRKKQKKTDEAGPSTAVKVEHSDEEWSLFSDSDEE